MSRHGFSLEQSGTEGKRLIEAHMDLRGGAFNFKAPIGVEPTEFSFADKDRCHYFLIVFKHGTSWPLEIKPFLLPAVLLLDAADPFRWFDVWITYYGASRSLVIALRLIDGTLPLGSLWYGVDLRGYTRLAATGKVLPGGPLSFAVMVFRNGPKACVAFPTASRSIHACHLSLLSASVFCLSRKKPEKVEKGVKAG